jgi:uncharacterized membrane protein
VNWVVYAALSAFFAGLVATLVLAVSLLHERAPVSAWLGTGLMLLGAVIVTRS